MKNQFNLGSPALKEKKKQQQQIEFIALLFVKNIVAEPTEQEGKYKCPETNAVISMTVPSVSVVFVVCFCLFLVVFPLPVPIHWIRLYR